MIYKIKNKNKDGEDRAITAQLYNGKVELVVIHEEKREGYKVTLNKKELYKFIGALHDIQKDMKRMEVENG